MRMFSKVWRVIIAAMIVVLLMQGMFHVVSFRPYSAVCNILGAIALFLTSIIDMRRERRNDNGNL